MPAILLAVLLNLASTARAEIPREPGATGGVGAAVTAGSAGYRRVGVYGDALWRGESLAPYVWGDYGVDTDMRLLSLGAGLWEDLREDLRVKGGLGFSVGRFRDSDER